MDKSIIALEKIKEAVSNIKKRLAPILQGLNDYSFGENTGRAQATVALSVGMMRYMSARLRGLDQGRKPDDPLRKDLNNMKRVLAQLTRKVIATATANAKAIPMMTATEQATETANPKYYSKNNLQRNKKYLEATKFNPNIKKGNTDKIKAASCNFDGEFISADNNPNAINESCATIIIEPSETIKHEILTLEDDTRAHENTTNYDIKKGRKRHPRTNLDSHKTRQRKSRKKFPKDMK